jgi:hypothetical protein
MSPKLPAKATLRSDTGTRPSPSIATPARPSVSTPHVGTDSPSTIRPGAASTSVDRFSGSQPAVIVSRNESGAAMVSTAVRRPLQDYWIASEAPLPATDTQGFRIFKGRRYVEVSGGHLVQVLIDPNIGLYRARLASERTPSGPLLMRDPDSKLWQPLEYSKGKLPILQMDDLNRELDVHFKRVDDSADATKQLQLAWHAQVGDAGERIALVQFEVQCHRHLAILQKALDFYTKEQVSLLIYKGPGEYEAEFLKIQQRQIEIYTRLMRAGDWRKQLDIPPGSQFTLDHHRSIAGYLKGKLTLLQKRQAIVDEVLKKSRYLESEFTEMGYDPMEIHENTADWLHAKSQLMAADQHDRAPVFLSLSFSETTLAFRNIDNIPLQSRMPVLSDLLEQCASVRASFEFLEVPNDAAHTVARLDMIEAVKAFENTLEQRLALYHQDLEDIASLPVSEESIDFDFIPAQGKDQPAAAPRRMFRSRHHGVDRIRVGQARRSEIGEELIDVMHPHRPAEVLQTYERREGQWRRVVAAQEKNLSILTRQAQQHLEQTDLYLRQAWQDEATRHNASSIVEFLGGKAEVLDDLCLQMEGAPTPATLDVASVLQRLTHDSQRLRNEGEAIRIRLYKDKQYLSADRVVYLLRHDELQVTRTQSRVVLGKAQKKDFLDVYSLHDKRTDEPLWEVHFHYGKKDSPVMAFKDAGGHLKTLEQARSGIASQRRDEQAGRPHVAIWRLNLDRKTAQKIFDLAS